MNQPNLDTLRSQLLTSGLQQSNPSLYQVIDCLIKAIQQFQGITVGDISEINNTINNITNNITNLNGRNGTALGLLLDGINDENDSLIPGPKGDIGPRGLNGNNGLAGIDGEDGVDGFNGNNGINGLNGINGSNGINGEDGEDGLDGFSIVGPQGLTGATGNNGIDGKQGIPGMDGFDGEDSAYYLLGQIIPSSLSSSGLTQPQVCKLVSLRG